MNLKAMAESSDVEYLDKGNGHIQLKGALLVNYYPNSKNKSAYVAGTKRAAKNVTAEEAIAMCSKPPQSQGATDTRGGNSRRKRKAMLAKGMRACHWCKTALNIDNSTIEHVIPLARGGLDNANNRVLACKPCNNERGHNMPELEGK